MRRVEGNQIVSDALPPIGIGVASAFELIGRLEFTIKDLALVERFIFADHDSGRIRRMFIAQFEGALPGIPLTYDIALENPVALGGVEYHHNVWIYSHSEDLRENPGAESERTAAFLAERGLTHEDELAMSRFARTASTDKRHEIILYYIEPSSCFGLSVNAYENLNTGRREAVNAELLARSLRVFTVEPASGS